MAKLPTTWLVLLSTAVIGVGWFTLVPSARYFGLFDGTWRTTAFELYRIDVVLLALSLLLLILVLTAWHVAFGLLRHHDHRIGEKAAVALLTTVSIASLLVVLASIPFFTRIMVDVIK